MVAMAKMRSVVLCVCVVATCWGGAAAQMGRNNITRSMLQELTEVLDREPVRFTEPVFNESLYVAGLQFDMRAMGLLYNNSHLVIDTIAKKQAYPEGVVEVSDGHFNVKPLRQEWRALLVHYAGPTSFVVAALLVMAVLPLVGLFWCCWYCCRMGRRRRPFDRKYDEWVKGILAIVLIGLLTAFLFGVVCAFATDSQVDAGAKEISVSMRQGLHDLRVFLNETKVWAQTLLLTNFGIFTERLNKQPQTLGMKASWKLGAFSRAASVTTLNQMVQQLDSVQEKLRSVHALTATLRHNADLLNSGLRKVKNQLLQTLAKCDQPKCRALQEKYKIGQLDTEIQYSRMLDKYFPTMPDVTELLNNVTQLLDSGIKEDMAEGQRVFDDFQRNIQRSIDERMPDVARSLGRIGEKLRELSSAVGRALDKVDARLVQYEHYADDYDELYARYGPYRRYAALAASIALLLITSLLTMGLMCGVCGKRPDVYGASDCCNKGAGSKCLLFGIFLIFVLGSVVTAVMLVHFLFGVGATRFICDPLTEPRGNRLFQDVDNMVDLEMMMFDEHRDPNFTLTSAVLACHRNETLYKTLHLWRFFNMPRLRADVLLALSARPPAPPPPARAPRVHILRDGARRKLQQLAATGLSDFDFDRILSALETNMTSLALEPLAAQLNSTARSLQQPLFAAEAASLRRASAALAELQRDVLRPMLDISNKLNVTARELRDDLRFNHSSLNEAVWHLMHETDEGEDFFNDIGMWALENLTMTMINYVTEKVGTFITTLEDSLLEGAARCGPMSNAFNATRDAFCHKTLMPVNGFWMSLCWCVLLLLPLLLVAQRLARLYRRAEPYPGPLVDAEYLYDAYADRDNVPLANGSKRSTLDIEGKIQEWRERSQPSAPPLEPPGPPAPPVAATRLLLAGDDVVCQLVPPPALLDDLKTRLDQKDEDNESGIHESE
ncbi:hypothetical protein PYW08_016850 [Mythimna loreyi]|uniref:Uncharacterized protein n=1 Tax=Mythimna loreyi TaxID=667449 RepID=A0ACC2R0A4_9NEOP|nr:hypothetical protein PYW08_016850 [Mythimna loreyi]